MRGIWVIVFTGLFAATSLGADDELQKLVMPLDLSSVTVAAVRERVVETLPALIAKPHGPPRATHTQSGGYVLYGDLFGKAGTYALFEYDPKPSFDNEPVSQLTAFAEFAEGKWILKGLWNIATVWRQRGWKPTGEDYLSIDHPAMQPFELKDFSGDKVPEVMMAAEVDKYYQAYYLLRFDPKTHGLRLLAYAMRKPEFVGDYVRLYFNSGRRSIFEEWHFCQWQGANLMERASWHDEVGYGEKDPTFIDAERWDAAPEPQKYRIKDLGGDSETEALYEITGNSTARVRFVWRQSPHKLEGMGQPQSSIELAYIFEKLTGLPRRYYPLGKDAKTPLRFEDLGTVQAEGSAAITQRFPTKK